MCEGLQRLAAWGLWHPLERPGVLLIGDRFLFALGMGTGPTDCLPGAESSTHSVNATSVLVQRTVTGPAHRKILSRVTDVCAVCPGLALGETLPAGQWCSLTFLVKLYGVDSKQQGCRS